MKPDWRRHKCRHSRSAGLSSAVSAKTDMTNLAATNNDLNLAVEEFIAAGSSPPVEDANTKTAVEASCEPDG
jgi:hypothetical protein